MPAFVQYKLKLGFSSVQTQVFSMSRRDPSVRVAVGLLSG
jgi:hypothetical protein